WSIKKLNRLILASETWRQSSSHPRADSYAGVDGDNRLLWRQNRRRMDFEQMRDSMIAVTGQLDRTLGGRCVEILQPPYSNRRTVYAFIDRQNLDPTFRNFDFSNPQQHTGQRPVTSIPMQGLFSLNSPFVQDKAKKLADLPPVRGAADDRARAAALHRAVLTRDAGPRDLELAEAFVRDFRAGGGPLLKRQTVTEWEYGYGSVDETTGEAAFTAYSHWTGDRWQVGAAFPLKDDPRSYLSAGPNGSSHPGYTDKECSIYRWTAPRDLTIRVSGPVERAAVGKGTGLGLRVAVSGQGIVLKTTLPATEKQKAVTVDKLTVKAGDTVDFVADPLENNNSFDSYNWRPEIADLGGSRDRWSQTAQFSGPADFMNEWEAYAQALLGTNDFLFVD
ncbi:MAG: DUF1553 domain-containing protein, partial [Verrucomicrobiae bacterium]|nr:DUF1553 domain-containing protein [Verrucomicrobiae bacterium]